MIVGDVYKTKEMEQILRIRWYLDKRKERFKRLLFRIRLRFNRRIAKEIFRDASCNLSVDCQYMCTMLCDSAFSLYDVCISDFKVDDLFRRYGFTRKNYHDFVKLKYPEFVPYLEEKKAGWIIAKMSDNPTIVKSKIEFLRELSERI